MSTLACNAQQQLQAPQLQAQSALTCFVTCFLIGQEISSVKLMTGKQHTEGHSMVVHIDPVFSGVMA